MDAAAAGAGSDDSPVIPGYSHFTLISRGSTAKVYRAEQDRLHRPVAIKVLRVDDVMTTLDQVEQELATTVSLSQQPHIISIIDTGNTDAGRPYIVMEYCEDGSYAHLMAQRGPLPIDEVVDVGIKVAEALQAAHEAGIIHRDVKPQNILRSRFGPALTDFGIARAANDLSGTITLNKLTPHHASPESLLRQAQGPPSDVYSLASTMWNLLAGYPPYADPGDNNPDPFEYRDRALRDQLPILPRPDVPPWLQDVLIDAMSKAPQERPQTAAAFADGLRRGWASWTGQGWSPPSSYAPLADVTPEQARPPSGMTNHGQPSTGFAARTGTGRHATGPPVPGQPGTGGPGQPGTGGPGPQGTGGPGQPGTPGAAPGAAPAAWTTPDGNGPLWPSPGQPGADSPPAGPPPAAAAAPTSAAPAGAPPAGAPPAVQPGWSTPPEGPAWNAPADLPPQPPADTPQWASPSQWSVPGQQGGQPMAAEVAAPPETPGWVGTPQESAPPAPWEMPPPPPPPRLPEPPADRPDRERRRAGPWPFVAAAAAGVVLGAGVLIALQFGGGGHKPSVAQSATATSAPSASSNPAIKPTEVKITDHQTSVILNWTDHTAGKAGYAVVGGPVGVSPRTMSDTAHGNSREIDALNSQVDYCFNVMAIMTVDNFAASDRVCTSRGKSSPSGPTHT